MAPGDPSAPRRPTGAAPVSPPPADDDARPTEEAPPLMVDGRVQPKNIPVWAKGVGIGIIALATSLVTAWGIVEPKIEAYQDHAAKRAEEAEARAKQAKQAAEGGYQVTKDYVQGLERRIAVLEAASKRAPARPGARRQLPVIAPARPAPLPHDLNAAEAQATKAAPPAQGPPPMPRTADAAP